MNKILLAASTALLAITAPAFAQDASQPAPDSATSFTGGRAEIFGGWDHSRLRERFADGSAHQSRNGVTGGVLLGYDFPIGDRFVAGPLASYSITSTKSCFDGVGCIKSGREIEGGARFGYKVGDKALVYAKGAYVNGQIRSHLVDDSGAVPEIVSGHVNRDGWRAGAGAEYALSKHAYVKAEYDYSRFKSYQGFDVTSGDPANVRFDQSQVLGGFGVRF